MKSVFPIKLGNTIALVDHLFTLYKVKDFYNCPHFSLNVHCLSFEVVQYLIKDSYHQCEIEKTSIRFQINFQIRAHPLGTYPNFSEKLAFLTP